MSSAYDALVDEAALIGWPLNFKGDLFTHDRERLERKDAPEAFGWVLRPCGTYLLDPAMKGRCLRQYESFLTREVPLESGDAPRYYIWTGETLLRVSNVQSFCEAMWVLHGELNPKDYETPRLVSSY